MSLQAMVWALKEAPVMDSSAKVILIGLADHAHDDGTKAFPSRATLASYARCSVRTVATKLKALEEAGLITRGDQQIVAHHRADRRPVVYDLSLGMKELHTVDDVQNLPAVPSDDVQNLHTVDDGVKSEVARGEAGGNHGVKAVAHKPSFNPSVTDVVVNSPEASIEQRADAIASRRGWTPSRRALITALETVVLVDIPIHIARYTVVCAEKRKQPSDAEWLRYVLADEAQAKEKARIADVDGRRSRSWHAVAE